MSQKDGKDEEDVTEIVQRIKPGSIQRLNDLNASGVYNPPGGVINNPRADYKANNGSIPIWNDGTIIHDYSANCSCCSTLFENQTLLDGHNWSAFKKCSVHRMCFEDWNAHNQKYEHTICGVQSCPIRGTDFNHNYRYLTHWRQAHGSHAEAELQRVGRGFCQQCYWQYGYSHDRSISKCRQGA